MAEEKKGFFQKLKDTRFCRAVQKLKAYQVLLIVSLSMILIGSIFASAVQSDFGKVAFSSVTFPTRDGQWVAADLYKPDSATFDNKAPLVVVVPGFQRSRETQSGIALELARRGIVVVNIDPYSQGDSSSSEGREGGAVATYEGYGSFDIINYIFSSDVLSYVDRTRIGITGHSAGGNAAYQAAVRFGREARSNGTPSKIRASYISGYVISIDSSLQYADSNMGFDYALYDEGAFRNKAAPLDADGNPVDGAGPTADMTIAVESHDFVNSAYTSDADKISYDTPLEMGQIYGSPATRTMRQVFNTPVIHAMQPYSSEANTNLLSFFEIALDFEYGIAADKHVWPVKEFFTTLALIGAFMFLVPFAILLFHIPFFKSAKFPVPPPVKKRKWDGKLVFWITFAINALIAALTYIPITKLTPYLFTRATNSEMTWFFPQRMNNAVMLWAVINGLSGMIVFLAAFIGTHLIKKYLKKRAALKNGEGASADVPVETDNAVLDNESGADVTAEKAIKANAAGLKTAKVAADTQSPEDEAAGADVSVQSGAAAIAADPEERLSIEPWGLKIKPKQLGKTVLMAFMITGAFFLLLHAVNFFFKVDFRFLFIVAVRPLNLKVILQMLMYVPLFFIFYLSNSIRVNGNMREEGQKEWLSLLIAGLANTLGLIVILAIQYIAFGATGTVFWTEAPDMTEWLYVNILFGLIPVMFVLPFFNRWFFKASGKAWLGPMVMCIIFIAMMLNNSVAYIPLP